MAVSDDFIKYIEPVGQWSERNFKRQSNGDLTIHYIAPLLGIVEELGELSDAKLYSQRADAICDAFIYFADFCYRVGVRPSGVESSGACDLECVMSVLGKLSHICLKRVQGIRGYDKEERFRKDAAKAVSNLLEALNGLAVNRRVYWPPILEATWSEVSRRNWVANPQDAHLDTEPKHNTNNGDSPEQKKDKEIKIDKLGGR